MNIHPLFVHFPIGILTLYVFFEIVRLQIITKQPFYFDVKAILVVFGTFAGFIATTTGDIAEELASAGLNTVAGADILPLMETHAFFAVSTITLFAVLAGSYLFEFCTQRQWLSFVTKHTFLQKLSRLIQKSSVVLALIAMVLMFITGGLGASIVYGPDFDPVIALIYDIFAP